MGASMPEHGEPWDALRANIRLLGDTLGGVIVEQEGEELAALLGEAAEHEAEVGRDREALRASRGPAG